MHKRVPIQVADFTKRIILSLGGQDGAMVHFCSPCATLNEEAGFSDGIFETDVGIRRRTSAVSF